MPPPKPTIYLIAGCNGAVKRTFAKEFLPSIDVIRFLDADEIARGLSPLKPEAVALQAWFFAKVLFKSDSQAKPARIASRGVKNCIPRRYTMTIATRMPASSTTRYLLPP